jgi:hypothetical protein
MGRSTLRAARCVAALAVAMAVWLEPATGAWATFRATAARTTTVSAHGMATPAQPTCSGLGVLSVHLSWPATSDASQADVYGSGFLAATYEVGRSATDGGPYTFVSVGTSTSYDPALSAGDTYFVVRTTKHSWHSVNSLQRKVAVVSVLFIGLLASCP